jgi:hypothetical protein
MTIPGSAGVVVAPVATFPTYRAAGRKVIFVPV